MEQIEIKRKMFDIIKPLGDHSYLVTRKNKQYFLKDFGNDKESFELYTDTEHVLNATGIMHPKIYIYDKSKNIVASEYIEGESVIDTLLKGDLPEKYFELIFKVNWFVKKDHVAINYDPACWKYYKDNLYYVGRINKKYDDSILFEKTAIRYWVYTKELVTYLTEHNLPIEKSRLNPNQAEVNKKLALTVVKYYI